MHGPGRVQLGVLIRVGIRLAVAAVVFLSACGGPSGSLSSGSPGGSSGVSTTGSSANAGPGATGGAPARDPLVGFIAETLGHDLTAIDAAVERARTEVMASCMTAEGWEFSAVPPPLADPSGQERIPLGEELLRELQTRASPERQKRDPSQDGEYNRDLVRCHQEAVQTVVNPGAKALEWLNGQTMDLYERVGADPRVVEAVREERRCLAEAGYPDPSEEETRIMDRAQQVAALVRSGELALEEATKELEELSMAQRAMWEVEERCTSPRVEVERDVAAELEREWLAANGDRLALVLAELRPDLEAISDQLRAVEEDR